MVKWLGIITHKKRGPFGPLFVLYYKQQLAQCNQESVGY